MKTTRVWNNISLPGSQRSTLTWLYTTGTHMFVWNEKNYFGKSGSVGRHSNCLGLCSTCTARTEKTYSDCPGTTEKHWKSSNFYLFNFTINWDFGKYVAFKYTTHYNLSRPLTDQSKYVMPTPFCSGQLFYVLQISRQKAVTLLFQMEIWRSKILVSWLHSRSTGFPLRRISFTLVR